MILIWHHWKHDTLNLFIRNQLEKLFYDGTIYGIPNAMAMYVFHLT